jgi:exopolyphosphatase/guanosine-5'-triphosphate,3'-diphosphate pyrophosphatase
LDIRQRTTESLATRYDVDTEQAMRVLTTTLNIFSVCKKSWQINEAEMKNMLCWASLLHEVGLQINSRGVQRHSGYILQNVDMSGFNQEQQSLLATLVRFHRKKIRSSEILDFSGYHPEQVIKLIALLRLGVLFNLQRQDNVLPDYEVKAENLTLSLSFPDGWLAQSQIFSADLEKEAEYLASVGIVLLFS